MRLKINLLLASPTSKGVDDGHFKPSVFLLSTEIRNSWDGLLCPSCLVCAIMGEAPMNLACLRILQVFASEMDVSEAHLVNLQNICFTGKMYVARQMSTLR